MWITLPETTQELKHPAMDESIVVDGSTVQVTKEVGEQLITDYEAVAEHNPE